MSTESIHIGAVGRDYDCEACDGSGVVPAVTCSECDRPAYAGCRECPQDDPGLEAYGSSYCEPCYHDLGVHPSSCTAHCLNIICAWCGQQDGWKRVATAEEAGTSHTICDSCSGADGLAESLG